MYTLSEQDQQVIKDSITKPYKDKDFSSLYDSFVEYYSGVYTNLEKLKNLLLQQTGNITDCESETREDFNNLLLRVEDLQTKINQCLHVVDESQTIMFKYKEQLALETKDLFEKVESIVEENFKVGMNAEQITEASEKCLVQVEYAKYDLKARAAIYGEEYAHVVESIEKKQKSHLLAPTTLNQHIEELFGKATVLGLEIDFVPLEFSASSFFTK